ncbi:hypothetical protein DL96DRAFT_1818449 [Flagelloscypha sp. PMI_526]|nr:hypothetical protein DL96DRAFT_1818449 [Flagelloscypha sp. PMI_526]
MAGVSIITVTPGIAALTITIPPKPSGSAVLGVQKLSNVRTISMPRITSVQALRTSVNTPTRAARGSSTRATYTGYASDVTVPFPSIEAPIGPFIGMGVGLFILVVLVGILIWRIRRRRRKLPERSKELSPCAISQVLPPYPLENRASSLVGNLADAASRARKLGHQ